MTRTSARTALTTVLAAAFVLGLTPGRVLAAPPPGCTAASLEGSFGFTSVGTLLAVPAPFAGPFGEIGRQDFDGNGQTDATATLSANGNIVKATIQGTYVVNPDCTGSMTLHILPFGSTATLDFVIDDDGTELRAIVTGAGTIETRVYKKQRSRSRRDQ